MAEASGIPSSESFERRERFGSFEILRDERGEQTLLGKGTFGRTYQARHIFLERTVALKIINDRFLTDATARQRFLVEARAAAKLAHPHIAQILDFGETDGILFYAMEYCSGGDLAEFVKRNGPLSVVQTMQIGMQVASALQCAHRAGFIHRDLKPSNVMLAAPGGAIVTKLIDFGLVIAAPQEDAEPIDPESVPTIEQRFIGTPLFASPEQLLVQPLDARSDFFSLGMTLWFLLVGAAPEPGNSHAIVASRMNADRYAPRLPQKLPRPFAAVLAKLLEKRAEDRFANATEVLNAFAGCAASLGMPVPVLGGLTLGGEAAPVESPEQGLAQPQIEEIDAPVSKSYTILSQSGESLTGSNYEAIATGESAPFWLHVLKVSLTDNLALMERLRANVAAVQQSQIPALIPPKAIRSHSDGTAIILEKPGGADLLTELKAVGALRLADARGLLQQIAQTCDALTDAGLPTPEMDGNRIFLELAPDASSGQVGAILSARPRLFPRFLTQRETSTLAAETGENSSAATMTYEMMMEERVDAPGWQFAMLIYRIVSGRNCSIAASLTPQNYVAVPALSEDGNRILSNAIARQLVHPTCVGLLADLLISEGLMGAQATRSQGGPTPSGSSTGGSTAGLAKTAPPTQSAMGPAAAGASLPTASRAEWETTGHTTHFKTKLLPRTADAPHEGATPPVASRARRGARRWMVLGGSGLIAILVGVLALRHLAPPPKSSATPFPVDVLGSVEVHLLGDIPGHARALLGGKEVGLQRDATGWTAKIEGSSAPYPAVLSIEARGFRPTPVELRDATDAKSPQEVKMTRSKGTLLFTRRQGADYDHAKFRMASQLPEEQAFVELARFQFGASFGSEGKVELPTGVYQVILQGPNEEVVRSRPVADVTIQASQTVTCELPLPIAGAYSGRVTMRDPAGEKTHDVELTIEPGLSTGSYIERTAGATRKLTISDGRLASDGTYTARIVFFEVADVDSQLDRLFSLKRQPDGSAEFEASEAPDDNATIEQRLKRRPYKKAVFSVKGVLRPIAR